MYASVTIPVVVSHLRETLSLRESQCFAHHDETVPPVNAEHRTIRVYPGLSAAGPSVDQELGFDHLEGINIAITHRAHDVPPDRLWSVGYAREIQGLEAWMRAVWTVMRRDRWQIVCDINDAFEVKGLDWRVVEPFAFEGNTAQFVEVGPDHFGADGEGLTRTLDVRQGYGVFVNLPYGSARLMARFYDPSQVVLDPISLQPDS